MQHFPIFVALAGRRVVLSGGGAAALAKLRLLLKTEANLTVIHPAPASEILDWAAAGKLKVILRDPQPGDTICAVLAYGANEDVDKDAAFAAIARSEGALVNIVDNLEESQFITPAIVDRDPVTVAIGTEGAAPVLARAIKTDLETRLPQQLGLFARIGKSFRRRAEALPFGRARRNFWSQYYFSTGPQVLGTNGPDALPAALDTLLKQHINTEQQPGRVLFVGAGPGDPELMTLKARKALDEADVVLHDRLVAPEILELARREADIVATGKEGFGPSMSQEAINELIVTHAANGGLVVRLKSGDPTVFGRLDEEIAACDAHEIDWAVVPGITAASAAVARAGQSLTQRGRNSDVRILTGHDMVGFAEHDWQALAKPGSVAAIYMAKRGARCLQGRLMMHGAAADTPVTIVENASRPSERVIEARLSTLAKDIANAELTGPAVLLYGLSQRRAASAQLLPLQKDIAL